MFSERGTGMQEREYILRAEIVTANQKEIEEFLISSVGVNGILRTDRGFSVRTTMKGKSAKELNRALLSGMRRVDRRVTLHSEWTCCEVTERFFGYKEQTVL